MAGKLKSPDLVYGISNALSSQYPKAIVAKVDPTSSNAGQYGQVWINTTTNSFWIFTTPGVWTPSAHGSDTQSSMTITGTSGTVLSVASGGNTVLGGNLNVSGATTVAALTTTGDVNVTGNLAVTSAAEVQISSSLAAAPAVFITATNASGTVNITGVGGINLATTNTSYSVNTGTGTINLSANAAATTVNIGTGAAAKTINIGNTTASTAIVLNTPSGTPVQATNGISVTGAGIGVTLPGPVQILSGTGSPNGIVIAQKGSLFLRTDGAAGNQFLYVNNDGNTSWIVFTAA